MLSTSRKNIKRCSGELPPAAFSPSSIDYILLTHPDNTSLDAYIDTLDEMSYTDVTDPEHEFYLYQNEIEKREQKLIIPVDENEIYNTVKNYCLIHDLSDVLYHIMEYPGDPVYDNILYFLESHDCESLIAGIPQQDVSKAFTWEE